MRSLVLLDFDGVVLKGTNPKVNHYIKHKINAFVQRKTRVHNKALISAFNTEVYQAYGHTVLGLKNVGIKCDASEFNHWVYSDYFGMKELRMPVKDRTDWIKFMDDMEACEMDVQFFSNAPVSWVKHFVGQDYHDNMFNLMNYVNGLRTRPGNNEFLKPERSIYDIVMQLYPKRIYYMIDDKLINFSEVSKDPRWIKLWVSGVSGATLNPGSAFFSLPNLNEAGHLIHCFEDKIRNNHVLRV
jgi:hypothetical protein